MPTDSPLVSFTISTHNRRDVLRGTLWQLRLICLELPGAEVLVVDNASSDGSVEMIRTEFPEVQCIPLRDNLGSCAKNIAIEQSRGQYIVFLDDDSYPHSGSVERMIEHFENDPSLGAAVFQVELTDGSRECSAYPDVFIGCGTGFRREALRETGLLPTDFFMQAEEYDLSLRLLNAGWSVRTFDDLLVKHLKTPAARRSWRTMRLDVRNNFVVAATYLPDGWAMRFVFDWMKRYYRIAASKGQRSAFFCGLVQGFIAMLEPGRRRPIGDEAFQRFSRMNEIEQLLAPLRGQTVLFVDYGKNILPFYLAAQKLGIRIVAIAENRMRGSYRGIAMVDDETAAGLEFDAAVVSNSSPVHAQARAAQWRRMGRRVVVATLLPRADECHPRAEKIDRATRLAA